MKCLGPRAFRVPDPGVPLLPRMEGALVAAAVGDALGWPQEDRGGRVGGRRGVEPKLLFVPWRRRTGGRYASHEEVIAAGEYSDDTQLTLAVARSVARGSDWWHHLTQVELPAWTSYERGGGGASKRAAQAWLRGKSPWGRNGVANYFSAGGNGVAMRAAPHCIWGARDGRFEGVARRVFADGVTTHGHPRAHVGAMAYGYSLWYALRRKESLDYGALVSETLRSVEEWGAPPRADTVPTDWWAAAGQGYEEGWVRAVREMSDLLSICKSGIEQGSLAVDREILEAVGAFDQRVSGAGTVTAAASIFLASRYAARPLQGLLAASFSAAGDTDTLGSMTGGLLGAVNGVEWLGGMVERVQDGGYIAGMARTTSARAEVKSPHPHPRRVTESLLKRFWATVMTSKVGEELPLPDGRVGVLAGLVEHPTKTRHSIRTWEVRADDGQTLHFKRIMREPASTAIAATESDPLARSPRVGVVISVDDMDSALLFYRDLIRLEISKRGSNYVSFAGHLVLEKITSEPGAPDTVVASAGPSLTRGQLELPGSGQSIPDARQRLTVLFDTVGLEAVCRRLIGGGRPVVDVGPLGGRRVFHTVDFDGTVVELRETNGS